MTDSSTPETSTPLVERLGEKSALGDAATEEGLIELANKLAPLIQGKRFHNVVDLLSLASDGVDMVDDAMVQKMAAGYEGMISNLWLLSTAARYAHNQAQQSPVPSTLGLLRAARDEDVRRGLHFALQFLAVIGRHSAEPNH